MKEVLLFLTGIFLTFGSHGQDRAIEIDLLGRRQAIEDVRIKEQTELVADEWKGDSEKDSAKIRKKNLFDKSGRITQVNDYDIDGIRMSIHYKPGRNGWYAEKEYRYYDSLGNLQNKGHWALIFDSKRRLIKEVLSINQNIQRTNVIKYDKRGNYVEQVTNGWWKWSFEYDRQRRVVASKECRLENDSMVCFNNTLMRYVNNRLAAEEIFDPRTSVPFQVKLYDYNQNGDLQTIKESKFVKQTQNGVSRTVTEYRITAFEYDGTESFLRKRYQGRKNHHFVVTTTRMNFTIVQKIKAVNM